MATYKKPFWEYQENIDRNVRWALNRLESGQPFTGQAKGTLRRLLTRASITVKKDS